LEIEIVETCSPYKLGWDDFEFGCGDTDWLINQDLNKIINMNIYKIHISFWFNL
jgi:hypothetical protein